MFNIYSPSEQTHLDSNLTAEGCNELAIGLTKLMDKH